MCDFWIDLILEYVGVARKSLFFNRTLATDIGVCGLKSDLRMLLIPLLTSYKKLLNSGAHTIQALDSSLKIFPN